MIYRFTETQSKTIYWALLDKFNYYVEMRNKLINENGKKNEQKIKAINEEIDKLYIIKHQFHQKIFLRRTNEN